MKAAKTHLETASAQDAQPPWAAMSDQARQQMATATEAACAVFRGAEAIRKIQQHAAHQALQAHTAAAEKLKVSCAPADVMNIQSTLLRANMEGAAQYWQQLAGAAMEMQAELMNCSSHLINSDAVLEAASVPNAFPRDSFTRLFGFGSAANSGAIRGTA